MQYLQFEKEQLVNLEYSLSKEILRSNRAGSYLSTTLNGCNTRKYHGLLVCPIENLGGEKHVLLSSLDETVIQNKAEFNLGIHRYQGGVYEPKGHKYISNVEFADIPKITYRVGGAVLTKERLLVEKQEQVLIRYTLEDAHSPTTLRLKPFLAFRNIHGLCKANMNVNRKFDKLRNGIKVNLYDGYPDLFMQCSKKLEFVPVPDWYYNIEYLEELNRGYEYLEDLFVPGYFELQIEKGESIVFYAGLKQAKPVSLKQRFTREQKKRGGKETFTSVLRQAAQQFVVYGENTADIIAGFPWYGTITRQTFVALPGLSLIFNDYKLCEKILDSYLKYFNDGFFPDDINSKEQEYNSADSSLWFVWVLQQYYKKVNSAKAIWVTYGYAIKKVLEAYRSANLAYVKMLPNGLIHAQKENTGLTWMDSKVDGKALHRREGLAIEVNALWYNAVCFALEMAKATNDKKFQKEWEGIRETAASSFVNTFWSEGHGYLADVINDNPVDWAVKPNMIIAVAMEYTPLSKEQQKKVLSVTRRKLLTGRGVRTLSPDHLRYVGKISGNEESRENAMHQGAVWPWLLPFFVEGYLKVHKQGGLPFVKQIVESFEEEMTEYCIGGIPEMYDGDPPHRAKGSIMQAWSVAGISYALDMVKNYEKKN